MLPGNLSAASMFQNSVLLHNAAIMIRLKAILAANIRKYRKKLRLTQEQAAERAGMSVNYWQRLELPEQIEMPSFRTFHRIAQTLHVKYARLLAE